MLGFNSFNCLSQRLILERTYQQVTVAAETDSGAHHPLDVDVRAQGLDIPETALQRALLREQRLQPGKRQRALQFKATPNAGPKSAHQLMLGC